MMQFKLFLQHLWKRNYTWDQSINEEGENLEMSDKRMVNKRKGTTTVCNTSLKTNAVPCFHRRVNLAYSVAIYVRNYGIQGVKTSLIFAKSRIAPNKGITIPRL